MLATFVIMLREGLEAALIVGIVAAFLRRNGRRLTAMWAGVGAALLISLLVGLGLKVAESSLPQRQQEGMETVIGAVAVGFVTSMIVWMGTHARELRSHLETAATGALGRGTSRALAMMAFLAVLKEGFEASVFLLATLQAAGSAGSAALGALLGLAAAVVLGVAIYRGGVRLDMARFFRLTSVFLVLVAAGLVVSALRTAHEAGWLNTGQQAILDMHWLAPAGSVRGALLTGVLGIPADPRLVEVLGWSAYVVPMLLLVLWPRRRRLGARARTRLKVVLAAASLALAGLSLALAPRPTLELPDAAGATSTAGDSAGAVSVENNRLTTPEGDVVALTGGTPEQHAGVTAVAHSIRRPLAVGTLPTQLDLTRLTRLTGNRIPVGIDAATSPGPYRATWSGTRSIDVWTVDGHLLDAQGSSRYVALLRDGGLPSSRTVTVQDTSALGGSASSTWSVETGHTDAVSSLVRQYQQAQVDARLWTRLVPAALGLLTLGLLVSVLRDRRRTRPRRPTVAAPTTAPTPVAAGSTH